MLPVGLHGTWGNAYTGPGPRVVRRCRGSVLRVLSLWACGARGVAHVDYGGLTRRAEWCSSARSWAAGQHPALVVSTRRLGGQALRMSVCTFLPGVMWWWIPWLWVCLASAANWHEEPVTDRRVAYAVQQGVCWTGLL